MSHRAVIVIAQHEEELAFDELDSARYALINATFGQALTLN